MIGHTLVARLDSVGDVLLAGPAVRAVAGDSNRVTMLVGPRGRTAADLLPGVDEVIEWQAPWVDFDHPPLTADAVHQLVKQVEALDADRALVLTSFHQSPLPLALILRMAAVPWIGAISVDYPGALLDLRHHVDGDPPEAVRGLSLAAAAGYGELSIVDSALAVKRPLPDVRSITGESPYVVVHPGAAVPARQLSPARSRAVVAALVSAGHRVLVTGAPEEAELTRATAIGGGIDLGGRTGLAELASVLDGAEVAVVPNTGPAHLAAAVGTPVVSLFAPVVPVSRWAPHGVPCVVLGAQDSPCAGTRARTCPVPGHPCLDDIATDDVVSAVAHLSSRPSIRDEREEMRDE
ncbi:glycosyltransferase family 9 protein [Rhodococcus sp. NPDC058521]|uniref:glycosyltransferase family 9 protein n=1 Tax=Rhodococcus sp. NPDC058521 TaxID=3346536 RepID=UPI0036654400